MKLNQSYPAVLWLLFVLGAPLATAILALITIPLLLTDVDAGLILLLAPGVITIVVLIVGIAMPGGVPRDVYSGALTLALARFVIPVAMAFGWYQYFDESARDETVPLVLLLVASGVVSLALWAWAMDYGLGVLTYLGSGKAQRAVAKRVDIKQAMGRDQRREMLRSRERRGRINRAIAGTRPPAGSEAPSPPPAPTVVWQDEPERSRPGLDISRRLQRLRTRLASGGRASPTATAPEDQVDVAGDVASRNGAAPLPDETEEEKTGPA